MTDSVEDADEAKSCSRCGEWLKLDRFVKSARGGNGRGSHCKACDTAIARARYAEKVKAEQGRNVRAARRKVPPDRDGQRWCLDCEQWVPLEDLHCVKTGRDGRASYCKPCAHRRHTARRAARYAKEGRDPRLMRPKGAPDRTGTRQCRDCREWLPLEQFAIASRRDGGRSSYCQPCMNERTAASYTRKVMREEGRQVWKPEELPEGMRRCADCREIWDLAVFPKSPNSPAGRGYYRRPCHSARGRESKERNFGGIREYHLQRRHGIGHAEFEELLAQQGGGCAICGDAAANHIDHNHLTGVIRGVLCFTCNVMLGNAKEDPGRLRKGIEYLEQCNNPWQETEPAHYVQMRRVIPQSGRNGRGQLLRRPLPAHWPDLAGDKPWKLRRV